jgi:hypothetical protein
LNQRQQITLEVEMEEREKDLVESVKRRAAVALEMLPEASEARAVRRSLKDVERAEELLDSDVALGKSRLLLAVDCLSYDVDKLEKAAS